MFSVEPSARLGQWMKWVRKKIEREYNAASQESTWRRWLGAALSGDGVKVEALVLATVTLLAFGAWSVASQYWRPSVLPSLAPTEGDLQGLFNTLWQAHTAIVGLSIPLLVLLIERSETDRLLATSAGQALISESWVVATSALALGSVVEVAIVSTYWSSNGALLSNLLLSCLCVVLIVRGYVHALRLLLSPEELRIASEKLLLNRLDRSVCESFVTSAANDLLFKESPGWSPAPMSKRALRSGDWDTVTAQKDGVLVDTNVRALKRHLTRRVVEHSPVGPESADDGSVTSRGSQANVLITEIGDRVHRGEALVAFRKSDVELASVSIHSAFRISDA